ncbi:MAG TPA: LysM domain-containing protein [Solirubrobacterales bacterium]|nr:LysM domain-containing protein [Solirubrobacterales bacterium]
MIIVIAATLGGGSGGGDSSDGSHRASHPKSAQTPAHTPKSYVVQNGDTLTSIAHKVGVPVTRILRLNPGVDPQILISGEKLKLK